MTEAHREELVQGWDGLRQLLVPAPVREDDGQLVLASLRRLASWHGWAAQCTADGLLLRSCTNSLVNTV